MLPISLSLSLYLSRHWTLTSLSSSLSLSLSVSLQVRRCLTAIDHISDLARENGITFVAEMFLGVFALPLEIKIFDAYYNDRRQGKRIPPSLPLSFF